MIYYYTDIQVDRYSRFDQKSESGYGLRLDNIIKCAEWIATQISILKPDIVINGGDTYNSIGIVASESLSATGKCISIINEACKEVGASHMMILGNHDMGILSNAVTTVDHFEFLSDIQIVKEPMTFSHGGHKFGVVPYSKDKNYTASALVQMELDKVEMAFTHLDYNGFRFNVSKASEADLKPDSFRNDFKIINGHYHMYQEIGNVLCPGSCIQHKYSEFSKKRGCLWIDNELNIDFLENDISPWMVKVSSIKELKALDIPETSYVYLDYNPENENLDELDAEMNRYARVILNRSSSSIKMKHIENKLEGDSPEEVFTSFIREHYETELDKETLLTKGLELL